MEDKKEIINGTEPSTLESIDFAVFDWVDKKINAHCNNSDAFKKVPVIWSSAERAYQIKNYKDLRDKDGSLITPFITVERLSINKSLSSTKGPFQANIVGYDRIGYTSIINQEKTSKYANNSSYSKTKKINYGINKNKKIVYQTKSIKIPIYIDLSYNITIKTSYLQQINEILAPFITFNRAGKHFMIKHESFSYEAYLEDNYEIEDASSMDVEERKYISKLSLKVIGFLTDADVNEQDSRILINENYVEFKFPKENILFEEDTTGTKKRFIQQPLQVGQTITALKKIFLIGNGIDSNYEIAHGLETRDMYVSVRLTDSPYDKVEVGIEFTDLNTIKIDTGFVISNNYLTVVIIG